MNHDVHIVYKGENEKIEIQFGGIERGSAFVVDRKREDQVRK